jgi:hypothetical protein
MNVPAPILVRPPVPAIEPEKMVLVLSLPVVSMALPSVTPPAPASEPIADKVMHERYAPWVCLPHAVERSQRHQSAPSRRANSIRYDAKHDQDREQQEGHQFRVLTGLQHGRSDFFKVDGRSSRFHFRKPSGPQSNGDGQYDSGRREDHVPPLPR